jgi:uncharacterized protein
VAQRISPSVSSPAGGAGRHLTYTETVSGLENRFEWDENKNKANLEKHGISFETARLVFDDARCLLVLDRIEAGEERWHAIGMILNTAVVLTVVHTYLTESRKEVIHIISARRATRQEQNDYAESL